VKFVVTGTGHSGTTWVADAFTWMGFPCGYWNEIPTDWPALHVIRDPFKVLSSLHGEKFFFDECDCHEPGAHRFSPYVLFMERHLPSCVAPADPLGRAINWIVGWTEKIDLDAQWRPIRTEKIEDLSKDVDLLTDVVEWATDEKVSPMMVRGVQEALSSEVNAHKRAPLTWDIIMANPLGPKLAEFSIDRGYGGPDGIG